MFAKHLPPSAGQPRVLALDDRAAEELPSAVDVDRAPTADAYDAVVGYLAAPAADWPDDLRRWQAHLRPGGRLILAAEAPAASASSDLAMLEALTAAGFQHCLIEHPADGRALYRGERPAQGTSAERVAALAGQGLAGTPYVFLLITQTPNRPAWRRAPDEPLHWHAATVIDPATGQPALLAFSSLVKAVAFMQPAILAGQLNGVNKVGQFPAAAAAGWERPCLLNPAFAAWRDAARGAPYAVDPGTALTGNE